MEGEATKGCKLIRFLSLHAPLPVLLLSNPGGQRCAAQRLNSQTQWGNNWYKEHLAGETLSVSPNDTFLLFSCFCSVSRPIQKSFLCCSSFAFIPWFYQSFLWSLMFCHRLNESFHSSRCSLSNFSSPSRLPASSFPLFIYYVLARL